MGSQAPDYDREERLAELAAIEAELERRRYYAYPDEWVNDRLEEFVWSKQREIMRSVAQNRLTAVPSCHQAGKSFVAARIAAWWIDIHPPGEAFVVTSATTGAQVRAVLWRELNRVFAKGDLPGRMNQTEWWIPMPDGHEEMVAFGRKPADMDPSAFQGIHARYVLVILDEAGGIPKALWIAADSLIGNDDSRMLVIGNPDDSKSEFAEVCTPGSGWNVIHVSAFDTPNFTGEDVPVEVKRVLVGRTWVEDKKRKWGESNPYYVSKVLGQFPENTADGLIPMSWIRRAQANDFAPRTAEQIHASQGWSRELGVDVGGGSDKNIIASRWGPIVRIVLRDQNPDTMVTCGNVVAQLRERQAECAKVDYIGIGKGVVDRGKEQDLPFVAVNVAWKARDTETYVNLRAEGWWGLRERFQEDEIDIDEHDDDLAAQLAGMKFKRTSAGKIQVESKEEIIRRLGHSPDDADAVMLAFMNMENIGPQPMEVFEAAWG